MSAVIPLHPADVRNTLRVVEESSRNVHWCHMHADLVGRPGRACFSIRLVEDILGYQKSLASRLRYEAREDDQLPHVILASDNPGVFNLGGDLELFCRLIRAGDRDGLLDYARNCVLGVHAFHAGLGVGAHTIALVQGDALGGGFEAALSCHTIVAEEGVLMGLPEVLFDLFPGMGAYSFLCKRVPPKLA
ncbi:MAG: enoyl-CoA hydratase, partial [Lysobacter sp.]|nr:enoyl-CoA hydratase [Lysobacter sp.]